MKELREFGAFEREPHLATYLGEIRDTELLDASEEKRLARRIQAGCEASLGRLVRANLPFVVHQVKRFRNSGVPLLELIAEGNLGLLRAAHQFDPARGTRFTTYAAFWIREAVSRLLARCAYPVSLPEKKARAVRRLEATRRRLLSEAGEPPSPERLAREARVPDSDLEDLEILSRGSGEVSHRTPATSRLGNRGVAETEDCGERDRNAHLARLVSRLEPRERLCLHLYFGIPGGEGWSFREIGKLVDLGREGARLLFHRALARLRSMPEFSGGPAAW